MQNGSKFSNARTLEQNRLAWSEQLSGFKQHPVFALIVGGDIGKDEKIKPFTSAMAMQLAKKVSMAAEKANGSLLVTNSRRTSQDATKALMTNVTVHPSFLFQWKPGEPSPYLGFLGSADEIIVTGDSMSMCSEAISTGKPVYIYAPEGHLPPTHQKFIDSLYKQGLAKPLENIEASENHFESKRFPQLPARDVANHVKELMEKRTLKSSAKAVS